jgi:hypothetical protein
MVTSLVLVLAYSVAAGAIRIGSSLRTTQPTHSLGSAEGRTIGPCKCRYGGVHAFIPGRRVHQEEPPHPPGLLVRR